MTDFRFGQYTPQQMRANPDHWIDFIIWHDINPVIEHVPPTLWDSVITFAK